MFTVYVNGILNASSCVDDLIKYGHEVISAVNNDGMWTIKFRPLLRRHYQ